MGRSSLYITNVCVLLLFIRMGEYFCLFSFCFVCVCMCVLNVVFKYAKFRLDIFKRQRRCGYHLELGVFPQSMMLRLPTDPEALW